MDLVTDKTRKKDKKKTPVQSKNRAPPMTMQLINVIYVQHIMGRLDVTLLNIKQPSRILIGCISCGME